MSAVPKSYTLTDEDRADPVVWITKPGVDVSATRVGPDVVAPLMGDGSSRKLKSLGHAENGAHFLLTRGGTSLHTDKAYARYSHQLVIRNDGNRLRGFEDTEQSEWHMPMVPGVMYCLDTHSPHQGLRDKRMFGVTPIIKVVLAVDRQHILDPAEALALLMPLVGTQLAAWENRARPVRTG
jgi:hypothetical protein